MRSNAFAAALNGIAPTSSATYRRHIIKLSC
jgi:hypothetical protein